MNPIKPAFARIPAAFRIATVMTVAIAAFVSPSVHAAGPDNGDLLQLLEHKGIISATEAASLRRQSDEACTNRFRAMTGMAPWVKSWRLAGDFRGRYEENNADNAQYITRDRFRFRLRVGLTASLLDDFDIGLRLASGNSQFNPAGTLVGGAPITANTDLASLSSRKSVWIDAAYAKWIPIHNSSWTVGGMIGKMDNPFLLSNMIWDCDINPEGAALQASFNMDEKHTVRGIGAFFVLDEINQPPTGAGLGGINATRDPYLSGAQILLESKWNPKFETSLGLAAFDIANNGSLSSKLQPFYNSGNTRDLNGFLKYGFDPAIASASATWKPGEYPFYPGQLPIKATVEYMNNISADRNNQAYRVGLTIGKAGRKHAWEVSYRYQRLEADAWFDALVDDDNGGFYATGNTQLAGTGKANGWFGGTNVRGHLAQASYSFTDYACITFTYYLNDLIIRVPGQSSHTGHFMADLMWRF